MDLEMVQYCLDDRQEWIDVMSSWDRAIKRLAQGIPPAWNERFLKPLRPEKLEDGALSVAVPGKFAAEWVRNKIQANLEAILTEEIGRPITLVISAEAREKGGQSQPSVSVASVPDIQRFTPNDAYRFDSFIVGQSNRLAFAGAKAVASFPGTKYNPLFIYGSSGLGKTHLLHSIAREILAKKPNYKIAYVTAQQFSEEFVNALQTGKIEQFRRSQRNVGVWLVDDIQLVAGRDRTQEEVFHTYNYLHSLGTQIVLTSDRPPRDLHLMDERLRSRFESGLVADIQAPDTETRCAIAMQKAIELGIDFDQSIAMLLAEHVPGNIRNLEGAIKRLGAESSVEDCVIDMDFVQAIIDKHFAVEDSGKPGPEQIIEEVSRKYQVPVEEIRGVKRHAPIVHARHVAVYLTRELTGDSWKRIGVAFGDRDHTSMMHGYQKINEMIIRDREVRSEVKQLMRRLKPQDA